MMLAVERQLQTSRCLGRPNHPRTGML
jgi:hypothetical protein